MKATKSSRRVTSRVSQTDAIKLREAADLAGTTLSQFMVQAALEKAEKVIERESTIYFSANDAAMLINLFENPAGPNVALTKAFERFKQREKDNRNR